MKSLKRTKNITGLQISKLGIKPVREVVNTIDELRNSPPNIVIAESVMNLEYSQNHYSRKQKFVKKSNYVMSLGVYNQIWYNKFTNQKILKPSNFKFSKLYKPYNGEPLDNKSLLVWRQGGIGDLLFISPNLRYLKEKYPTCKLIIACGPQYQSMIKTWDFIDEVIDLPFTVNYLFNCNYHCMFEGVIERCKEAEVENAYKLFTKWMNLNLHESQLYPDQEIPENELQIARNHLENWGLREKDYIVVQYRASSPIRAPRFEVWKKIIDGLTSKGHKIVIIDSVNNVLLSREFIEFMKDKHMIYNFSEFSDEVLKTMAITKLSKFAIATDSALIHIAESLRIKSFGIFGPFKSKLRIGTYRYAKAIDCKKDCAPCFIHSQYPCKHSRNGYSTCYDTLDSTEVIDKIEKHMNKVI